MRTYLLCFMIAATIGISLHVILSAFLTSGPPDGFLIVGLAYSWAWNVKNNEVWHRVYERIVNKRIGK